MKNCLIALLPYCLIAAVTTANAQQMTIDSATKTYEKRLAAAAAARTAETAAATAAYEQSHTRATAEYSVRVQGALRSATGDEAIELQKMLAALAPPDTTPSGSAPAIAITAAEFDKHFDSLVGKWNAKEENMYKSNPDGGLPIVSHTRIQIFEIKHPKTLVTWDKYIYSAGNNSETKRGEFNAKLRDGKIVFEKANPPKTAAPRTISTSAPAAATHAEWYEIPIPFDLDNLVIHDYRRQPAHLMERTFPVKRK